MSAAAVVAELAARVQAMEATRPARTALALDDAGHALLPDGLVAGNTYLIEGSTTLAAALAASACAPGYWSAVIGVPALGAEAAHAHGLDLDRTLLVPDPGPDWCEVVAAVIEAVSVVVLTPPSRPSPGEVARISARLRARTAALILLAEDEAGPARTWPRVAARITLHGSRWRGIGEGRGHLTGRELGIEVTTRSAPPRRVTLIQQIDGLRRPSEAIQSAEGRRDVDIQVAS